MRRKESPDWATWKAAHPALWDCQFSDNVSLQAVGGQHGHFLGKIEPSCREEGRC